MHVGDTVHTYRGEFLSARVKQLDEYDWVNFVGL